VHIHYLIGRGIYGEERIFKIRKKFIDFRPNVRTVSILRRKKNNRRGLVDGRYLLRLFKLGPIDGCISVCTDRIINNNKSQQYQCIDSKPAIIPHHITCPFPIIISFTEYPVFVISITVSSSVSSTAPL